MHYTRVKGILSSKNGINLYRGCTHGCIYCDSRSTCYQMNHDFEDVEVKINAPELLREKLMSKRKRCMIGMGSMCDPYFPLEEKEMLTHRCLKIIEQCGCGVTLITKSERVLRDLELLKRINEKTKCVIQMTLTTYDEQLCKIIEPNVCTTQRRFEVLKCLSHEGIPTVVWLSPILPFINDTEENLRGILNYCSEAGVRGIICFGMGVTLREGSRDYFYRKLDEYFPGIREQYIRTYGNMYECLSQNSKYLNDILKQECYSNNISCNTEEIFNYLTEFEDRRQIKLF